MDPAQARFFDSYILFVTALSVLLRQINQSMIFHSIVYGPVHSRRLGISLGVNLFPTDGKICTFDCVYCECGYNNDNRPRLKMPGRDAVREALEEKLEAMKAEGIHPDVITFAGNGEPTMHPDFAKIIDDTIALRDLHCPAAKVAVLSNSTMLGKEDVFQALCKVEDNIMKLDSTLDRRIMQINVPAQASFCFSKLLENLCRFQGNVIIQTMFLHGERHGEQIDNTSDEEVAGWISALKKIRPRQVMIYTIDRPTPLHTLSKATPEELDSIAERARAEGFNVTVSY